VKVVYGTLIKVERLIYKLLLKRYLTYFALNLSARILLVTHIINALQKKCSRFYL